MTLKIASFKIDDTNFRSKRLAQRLRAAPVDSEQRGREKPSDHAPVCIMVELQGDKPDPTG